MQQCWFQSQCCNYPQFHGSLQSRFHFVKIRVDAPEEVIRWVSKGRATEARLLEKLENRQQVISSLQRCAQFQLGPIPKFEN